jgi:pyridoxamine 5'-phosphate oxidase
MSEATAPSGEPGATPFAEPFERFAGLLRQARKTELREPTAMALATVAADGRPSVRMVLLKDVDTEGFVFYTNLESRKAVELAENPQAALCFHWQPLETQVRVEGRVQPVSAEEADAYYASRARGSQIGAWASRQSAQLDAWSTLEERVAEVDARYAGGEIPRPPFWSGFRLVPDRIEFWYGRPSRLHQRDLYLRSSAGGWTREMLYP